MDTHGKFTSWRFSVIEAIGAAISLSSLAVGITLWSISTFQNKEDAIESKRMIEARIATVEDQVRMNRASLDAMAKDVSYIRGRLEPRLEEKR